MTEGKTPKKTRAKRNRSGGKVTIIGIGPGSVDHMTNRAILEIRSADSIVGLSYYIQQIRNVIRPRTRVYPSSMRHEIDRASLALKLASKGEKVAVISGGDPGVYGMAGPIYETARRLGSKVEVNVVPGVTAATASAATLGSPLMTDFAVISLSDLLVPRKKILTRVKNAIRGDFVLVLYNPQSRTRRAPLKLVHEMLTKYRKPTTPVGIVTDYARKREKTVVTTLQRMLDHPIGMTSTIIVGNSSTVIFRGTMQTPRGYYRPTD